MEPVVSTRKCYSRGVDRVRAAYPLRRNRGTRYLWWGFRRRGLGTGRRRRRFLPPAVSPPTQRL